MPPNSARTVFVANIPYDVSEEQLANTFSEVGPVADVEIKFDPATGKSKGFGFVRYQDPATAHSAVRNLHEVFVNGRNLRVELSTEEPGPRRRGNGGAGGGSGGGGGGGRRSYGEREPSPPRGGGGYGRRSVEDDYGPGPGPGPSGPPLMAVPPSVDVNLVPPGYDVPPGQNATDAISKTLAGINPGEMQAVMAGMKTLIATQPEQARQLLMSKPQLAYALFQAMLLMNIVDSSVLQRITPVQPTAVPPPTQYPPPQPNYSQYPPGPPPAQGGYPPQPQQGYRPPPQQSYGAPPPGPPAGYGPPPPAAAPALSPQVQAQLATLPEDQRAMLLQVLTMTPDQINAVDPTQRESIRQLRQQFLGVA